MRITDRIIYRSFRLLRESSGIFAIINAIVLILRSLLPVLLILLLRYYVNGLIGADGTVASSLTPFLIRIISVIVLAFMADDLLAAWGYYASKKQAFLLELHISSLVHKQTANLGLRFFEDPSFHDLLSRAVRDMSWRPAGLVSDTVSLLRGLISFFAMAVVLWRFSPVAIITVLVAFIPMIIVKIRNSERINTARKSSTPLARQASYFSWLLTGERPAREVKLFDISGFFEGLFIKNYTASKVEELKVLRRNATAEILSATIKMVVFAGVIVYASLSLIHSEITAGEMVMYLVAFRQSMVYLRDTVSGMSGLYENRLFINDLFNFLDIRSDNQAPDQKEQMMAFNGLEICNMSFTYPGANVPAIQNISIRVNKGEKLAIVGPNGSGKTTLVKLLCRLYDPDSGEIRHEGKDIKELDINSYRKLFSVVFQDFMLYFLTAAGNIRMGDTSVPENFDRIKESAEKAGISDFLDNMPDGYNTMLGHHTEGGRELSWGEWQKIAIARALYREAPVLILDEPSSSLDADSEFEIFSRLGEITHGRTCILISHRMANVADADRIVVLQKGQIAETGTHDELVSKRGLYYSMYSRQKALYR